MEQKCFTFFNEHVYGKVYTDEPFHGSGLFEANDLNDAISKLNKEGWRVLSTSFFKAQRDDHILLCLLLCERVQ